MPTASRPVRVLFIHGLESRANGSKARMLREQGFDVVAEEMHMGLFQLRRRNSAIRQLPRLGESRVVGALALGLLVAAPAAPAIALGSALSVGWALARRRALLAKALGRSFDACLAIQRQAVEAARPDVVVGSSWGGAIAARLVIEGTWSGPTILLAPAVAKVERRMGRGDGSGVAELLRARAADVRIVVFHDPSDDTVPFEDSALLAQGGAIELRSVSAGGHRLLGLLERGELADAIRALCPPAAAVGAS